MSRLTDETYLQNHTQLRETRAGDNTAFILLSPSEQRDLFRYYLLHERLNRKGLLAHRANISRLDPSLPQRAGRALSKLHRIEAGLPIYREHAMAQPRPKKNVAKQSRVFSEVNPDPDPKRIAKILLDAAQEEYKAQRAQVK